MDCIDLSPCLQMRDLENLIQRYHFQKDDLPMLQSLYKAVLPLIHARAYSLWKPSALETELEDYSAVLLTLGDGIDALQEVYLERQCISEAYMLDCIGLSLLTGVYEDYAGQMQLQTGMRAVRLHFIGERYPFSMLDKIADLMGKTDISYNAQYVMTPKNSVAFLLELEASDIPTEGVLEGAHRAAARSSLCHVRLAHICETCANMNCPYRQKEDYNYGYQRIFGSRKI